MAVLFRTTPAGARRDLLTGLLQERAEMDPDVTVAAVCNWLSLQELEKLIEHLGIGVPGEEDDDA